jgi:hypothetical protein
MLHSRTGFKQQQKILDNMPSSLGSITLGVECQPWRADWVVIVTLLIGGTSKTTTADPVNTPVAALIDYPYMLYTLSPTPDCCVSEVCPRKTEASMQQKQAKGDEPTVAIYAAANAATLVTVPLSDHYSVYPSVITT